MRIEEIQLLGDEELGIVRNRAIDALRRDAEAVKRETAGVTGTVEARADLATLRTSGMPALPKGDVYQVWAGPSAPE